MNANVFLISLFIFLFLIACNDTHENLEFTDSSSSETLNLLSEIYSDKRFELISESDDEIHFSADGKRIYIKKESENKYLVTANGITFFVRYNAVESDLQDYLLDFNDDSSSSINTSSIEILDENMNRMEEMNRYIDTQQKYLINDELNAINLNQDSDNCTTDNVLDCVAIHCEDAGAILCTGCVLYSKCLTALTVWCAVDVIFENENPLYCEESETLNR